MHRLKKLIAAVLLTVLMATLAVPAFAASSTQVEAAAVTTQGSKKKIVLIGDSRTASLREVRTGKLIYDLFQQDGSILWDFKWGAKFTDMTTNLVPRLETSNFDAVDPNTTIVVWMGYNDACGVPAASAGEYVNYYNLMTALWTLRGAKVYIVNVGPAGCKPNQTAKDKLDAKARNKKIRAFNNTLKEGLSDQATYLDLYRYLVDYGYSTVDNTHYLPATNKVVYRYIMNRV